MKNILLTIAICSLLAAGIARAQDITNTLPANGLFIVKDNVNTFLSLSQSTGHLSLNNSLNLPNTADSTLGVIYKNSDRFIHNYSPPGADGYNTFIGINSGNFTMTAPFSYGSSRNTAVGSYSLNSNTTGYENTAIGLSSLTSNTTGYRNTSIGGYSLYSNTSGNNNSAFGLSSLRLNVQRNFNSAFGDGALYSNLESYNSAFGYLSLATNTTGTSNSAFGSSSLLSNSTGANNSAFGFESLKSNTNGIGNTAMGTSSLYSNTPGEANSAQGFEALYSNTTGFGNTANGRGALYLNITGNFNTALGGGAGSTITTGSNLICIGFQSEPTSGSAIGQITLGNGSITTLRCNTQTITALSDIRDKKNITDLSLGLDFITKLKPRQFNWDRRDWYENNESDGSKMKEEPTAGFIAQELDEIQNKEHAEWLNLVLKDNPEKWEATYGNLLPIMVKAIQELAVENEQLKIENEKLNNRLTEFEEIQITMAKKFEQFESNKELFKIQIVNTKNNNQ